MNELQVKFNDLHIGTISIQGKDEIYKFEYIEKWEQSGYEISLTYPSVKLLHQESSRDF